MTAIDLRPFACRPSHYDGHSSNTIDILNVELSTYSPLFQMVFIQFVRALQLIPTNWFVLRRPKRMPSCSLLYLLNTFACNSLWFQLFVVYVRCKKFESVYSTINAANKEIFASRLQWSTHRRSLNFACTDKRFRCRSRHYSVVLQTTNFQFWIDIEPIDQKCMRSPWPMQAAKFDSEPQHHTYIILCGCCLVVSVCS